MNKMQHHSAFTCGLTDSATGHHDTILTGEAKIRVPTDEAQVKIGSQQEVREREPTLNSFPSTTSGSENPILHLNLELSGGWVSIPSSPFSASLGARRGLLHLPLLRRLLPSHSSRWRCSMYRGGALTAYY